MMGLFDSFKEPDVAKMVIKKDVSGLIKALKKASICEQAAVARKDVKELDKQVSILEKEAAALKDLTVKGVDAAELGQILPEVDKMLHDFAQLHFDVARECSRRGNVAAEIDWYTKSIQASPSAAAFFNRGNAYHSKGDNVNAIADYTKAIEINSKYLSAYNNRGMIYVQREDAINALRDFEKVFELTPNSKKGQKAKENISKLQSILEAKKRD